MRDYTADQQGHRPCAECQRDRFNRFRETWAKANPEMSGIPRPAATTLDAILHQERIATRAQAHGFCNSIENLPGGVFVTGDEQTAYLVLRNQLLRWSPGGYEHPPLQTIHYPLRVLTPASVVRTIAAGYPVNIHPSAW